MRLHRFYTTEKIEPGQTLEINSAELANQVGRVFRLKAGDSIILFSGTGFDYLCNIDSAGSESIIVRVEATPPKRSRFEPARKLILCAGIVKKDTFEWIVEKATELGVTDIIPVMAERSEKKSLNEDRLKKIAIEASEQSGRGNVPFISSIKSLSDIINDLKKSGIRTIAFHTEGEQITAKDIENNDPIAIFIGPEGGWSEKEINLFHEKGVDVRCLGNQVLRAETAVVATLAVLVFGTK